MKTFRVDIKVRGYKPGILFDRYPGSNDIKLSWQEKVWLDEDENLVLPSNAVMSFLTAKNIFSAFYFAGYGRKWKNYSQAALSYVSVEPELIPFMRDGKKISLKNAAIFGPKEEFFGPKKFPVLTRLQHKSLVMKQRAAIPNPKERPLLQDGWELEFYLDVIVNGNLSALDLKRAFNAGGMACGFGTYRPQYGKFLVTSWEVGAEVGTDEGYIPGFVEDEEIEDEVEEKAVKPKKK